MSSVYGTTIGDVMAPHKSAGWGGPCFGDVNEDSGGVRPGEAQLLYGLVCALKPAVILEVGTGYGWSGIHLAVGLQANGGGKLHTVEVNAARQEIARRNVAAAGVAEYVAFYTALPDLPRVDLAFIDAAHYEADVRGYLAALPAETGLVLIHDAAWEEHVARAIAGTGWKALYLPGTSYAGLALLQREVR